MKFAESPQMKLNKDTFPTNMNMVELDGKKVLIQPSQAKSTKGKEVIIWEERPPRMIKPKSLKDGQWQKNEGSKLQRCPKATFDILMAKYKKGRVGIRGHKNWIIQNTKPDNLISMSQASTSTARSSIGKGSRTLPRQNLEGRDHRQQDYHPMTILANGSCRAGLARARSSPCLPTISLGTAW
jgi:hypothetical protein